MGVDVNPNEISELATRTDKGYLLEVDVSYPKELHNLHNDLPFMCERMEINGVENLVPNLRDKKNYVIHIQALNQALQHGLRLDGIHQAIEFDQLPWLKTYINFNTQLQSVSWFLAEFYFNRGLQRLYTGTCIILQKTINGFLCLLIVFLKSKTYQLILKDVIKLNRNLR